MANIEVREKIAPYSHTPGVLCLIPLSDYVVQVYPALLKVGEQEIPFHITGPVKNFTVQMDLERDCVLIWGIAKEGKYKFKLTANEQGLFLDDKIIATGGRTCPKKPCERLSLGNWKAQDWDLARRRKSLIEIAPTLFLLGQKTPIENASLITHDEHFFLAASENLCVPTKEGARFQGIAPIEVEPLSLFKGAYQTFRSYLLDGATILPHIPGQWHAGRALNLVTPYGQLDLEWTKHKLRRMILRSEVTQEIIFYFTKVNTYRWAGKRLTSGAPIQIESGKTYLFDAFAH